MSDARLFSELIGKVDGPILVIGGGPSAVPSLDLLKASGFAPAAVLSANEHGHKQDRFPVTHSVCCDGRHGEKHVPMERLLRSYGDQPIIATGHFADYRLPEWSLAANTGLTAIAVAVFMGGHPVVVVGIDFYRFAVDDAMSTYFHAPNARSNSTAKNVRNFTSQLDALAGWIGARAPVRVVKQWPRGFVRFATWDPLERVDAVPLPPRARWLRSLARVMVECRAHRQVSFVHMHVEPGRIFPVSPNEAKGLVNTGWCRFIEAFPPVDGSELRLPPDLRLNALENPELPAILRRAKKQR